MTLGELTLEDLINLIMKPVKRGYKVKFRPMPNHHATWDKEKRLITIDSPQRERVVKYFIHEKLHHLEATEDNTHFMCSKTVETLTKKILSNLTEKQKNTLFKELANLL